MSSKKVTPASQWREAREVGYIKELPSGKYARLRAVSPDMLLQHIPDIPNVLKKLVLDMLFGGKDSSPQELLSADNNRTEEERAAALELCNIVCKLAFVEPKVVDEPVNDDEISIYDIDIVDRGFVFALAVQPAEVLRTFRFESTQGVESISDGQDNGQ